MCRMHCTVDEVSYRCVECTVPVDEVSYRCVECTVPVDEV